MRVIIAGGTGLIGSLLTRDLVNSGHEAIILSRNPTQPVRSLPAGVQVVGWDGRTANGWGHLVEAVHAIVNLTGVSLSSGRWTKARKKQIVDSRILPGKAILEAVQQAQHKPEDLIQSSGVNYYGTKGDHPVTEADPPGDDFLGRLCVQWEQSTQPVTEMGVRHVVIRTAPVLDRKGGALPLMLLPFRFFIGGPVGTGRQYFPWIHHADEVGAIRFLIDDAAASGPYNLIAPQAVTNREFAKTAGKVMHRPAIFPVPAFVMRLVFGEMSTIILEGLQILPQRLQEAGYSFRFPTLEAALKDVLA